MLVRNFINMQFIFFTHTFFLKSQTFSYCKEQLQNFTEFPWILKSGNDFKHLTLKLLGGRGRGVNLIPHPMVSQKMYLPKERVKLWFFVTFNIILKNIFPENFIEIPRVVKKLWRISLSILAISIDFHQFYGFFDIFFDTDVTWC